MKKAQFKNHGYKFEIAEEIFLSTLKIGDNIKPGDRIHLLTRNSDSVTKGRRFAYIGSDYQIHTGRYGKPLKIKRLWK